MRIPQDLPQFCDKSALIIVTGRRAGKIYQAADGKIGVIDTFEIPIPHFSDNEGFFESSGHGRVIRSGSTREINEQDLGQQFLRTMKKHVEKIVRDYKITDIYLFSPREHELEKKLPRSAKNRLQMSFIGSFGKAPVRKLLEIIQQKNYERLVSPLSEEALELINRPYF